MIHARSRGWCDACGSPGSSDIIHVDVEQIGHHRAHALTEDPNTLTAAQIRLSLAQAILYDGIPIVDTLDEFVQRVNTVVTQVASVVQYGPDELPLLKARHEALVAQRERDEYARRVAGAQGYLTRWDPEDWDGLEEMKIILDGGEP